MFWVCLLVMTASCSEEDTPGGCDGVACSGHGVCVEDADGNASCECDACYLAEGLTCVRQTVTVMDDITSPTVWRSQQDIEIGDFVYVNDDLTVEACARVRVFNDGALYVSNGGRVFAEGTVDHPVLFTSAKASPAAGDWRNIEIQASASAGTSFDHTVFEYGGNNDYGMLWVEAGAEVSVTNSTFREGYMHAVDLEDYAEVAGFGGNRFEGFNGPLIKTYTNTVASLEPIVSANNTDDVVLIVDGDTAANGTWKNLSVPYQIGGYLYIYDEVTVEAGTTLLMRDDVALYVQDGGALLLDGVSDNRITVTSAKSGPAAGDWRNIEIYDSASSNSRFSFTDISFGGGNGYGQLYVDAAATIALDNVTFSDALCDVYNDYDQGIINATDTTYSACAP